MLLTRRADPPETLEGAQTYETPESRKALLTEELEKRKTGGELVSFGFSASNACSDCIPLHHRSGNAIQNKSSLLEFAGRCAEGFTDKVVEEFASYRRAQHRIVTHVIPRKYASWLAIAHWTGG